MVLFGAHGHDVYDEQFVFFVTRSLANAEAGVGEHLADAIERIVLVGAGDVKILQVSGVADPMFHGVEEPQRN